MGLLNQLKNKYSVVSIIGMEKNAVRQRHQLYTLRAMDEGMCLGVTPTDGTEKARIW
jgi:hypothetical protein